MKKILIMSLFTLIFMQACKEDLGLIGNEKPEERVSKELQKFNDELVNSPNGWVAHLYTTEVKGDYSFYMNFKENNVLGIRADFEENSLNIEQTSTYRLKKVMATTLIFDTDNYLHLLIDPESDKGGKQGLGFGSDVEFEIKEQVGDTLKLVGKRRKTILTLVKASAADKDFYTNDGSKAIRDYVNANPFLYVLDEKDNTKKIQVSLNSNIANRIVSLTAIDNGKIISAEQPFSFSLPGISNSALTYAGRTFISFELDKTNQKLFAKTTTGQKIEVLVSPTPIVPLHVLIGERYKNILVANQVTYPGWGNDFVLRRATAAILMTQPYRLRLETMNFEFITDTKQVVLTVGMPQGTTQYWAYFGYNYTQTDVGIFKFTKDQSYRSPNTNANSIAGYMAPLLADRLEADTFALDYFVDPTTKEILAQFKSIEHPAFTFTGTLF